MQLTSRRHHICLLTLQDKLHCASIGESPRHILDIGKQRPQVTATEHHDELTYESRRDWKRYLGDVRHNPLGFMCSYLTNCSEIAHEYPSAQVTGTGLASGRQAAQTSNLRFDVLDVEDCSAWTFPENHFDLIHMRGLSSSIADWPSFYSQVFKHVRPGGSIEQVEWSIHLRSTDGALSSNTRLRQ